MAIVSAEVRFAPQLTAWFTANPTKVLQDGEIVYCSDGANVGKYVIGDNSAQLSTLTFYGGISSSGLTIGTTTITSGTNTRILYNNAGVVGEYLVTGTGTTAVLSTSPTFTTSIITPLVYGSSSSSGNFSLESTSNATKGIINIGSITCSVRVGSGANNTGNRLFRVQQDTAWMDFGSLVGATNVPAIYFLQTTPSVSSYALAGNATQTFLGASTQVDIRIAQVTQVAITSNTFTFKDAANLVFNATTGTKLGTATTQKIGFWNATPIVQPSGATQAAPAAYATGAFGLDSDANMQALYDLVVAMRTAMVNSGLMKGAA